MILRREELKEICSKIVPAIVATEGQDYSELLEFHTENNLLIIHVSSQSYTLKVTKELDSIVDDLHATISAPTFLKLINQITSETIDLSIDNNSLKVVANGTYKFPLIYREDQMVEIPQIEIENKTKNFIIKNKVLQSILTYNSKYVDKKTFNSPLQRLYYVDKNGCLTFISGACLNSFTLDEDVKLLLEDKCVKLFSLFVDEDVNFTLGFTNDVDEIQTRVNFHTNNVDLTIILPKDMTIIDKFPVEQIRTLATTIYENSVVLDTNKLQQSLNRLSLFRDANNKSYLNLTFDNNGLTIQDFMKDNEEKISFEEDSHIKETYELVIDADELKQALSSFSNIYINISFGNHRSIMIQRENITIVVPECAKVV